MTQKNPTFRSCEPSWANACVGNNGNPSYVEYSKGFSKAANLLIDQVLEDKGIRLYVDDFIYPVCFNMRHSVELRLKGAIDEITEIAKNKNNVLKFDSSSSHDINKIWSFFRVESEKIDRRYFKVNENIEPTILDIAEVDPTGQTFRYPISNTSQKHLTDVSLINFIVLKYKFKELEKHLDHLHNLNQWLTEEYTYGTFTSKLSRADIFKISEKLPQKENWRTPEFAILKEQIQAEYNLGSRDFSKAIDLIQTHYTLAPRIGSPIPLKGISEEDLLFFIDAWIKENPEIKEIPDLEAELVIHDSKSILASIRYQAALAKDSWNLFSVKLSAEYLAGIESLFYFARDKILTEYYIRIYEFHLKSASSIYNGDSSNLKNDFRHIYTKTNAVENILISLYALGHCELAEKIIETHALQSSFSWLDSARTGYIYSYPTYAGY